MPVCRAFEGGQALLEGGSRGVRDSRVVVPLVNADGVLDERRRLVDRGRYGSGRRIRLLPHVDRLGLELHGEDATGVRCGA